MATPYVGEIKIFAGTYNPVGWEFCEGQLLSISDNETLFQLLGTTYGGDGESTFGLPDLRGRLPLHMGGGFVIAETGGAEEVTLTTQQMPVHTHALLGNTGNGGEATPAGNVLAGSTVLQPYAPESPNAAMAPSSIAPVGGSQPHTNFQPYLCLNFIISLYGIFPSPT